VTDQATGAAISGATVSITGAGSTITAANGAYILSVPTGDMVLTVDKDGYTGPGSINLSVASGDVITRNVTLASQTVQTKNLTVNVTGTGAGTVTSSIAGINCGSDCSEIYTANTAVVLTATPSSGSVFSGWSGACTGTGVCQTTLIGDKTVTATFSPATALPPSSYTVTPSAGTGGSISPSTAQTVNNGGTTSFTIIPNSGYHISSITGCGGTLSGSVYTTGAISANCTVTAIFTARSTVPDGRLVDPNQVSIADALRALRIASGLITPTANDLAHGDVAPLVNNVPAPDGKIDLGDVIVILRKSVGLVTW